MKLSKHAKFWALGVLGGVGLFALGVFAQQNGALDIDSTNQDLFSDLKAVFFLERKEDNNEIDSIVRLNVSNGTVVSAPTSDLAGGEAKNTLQNNASIIGSTNSVNTSSGAFLIATNSGRVEGESMQSFVWGASNTTLNGYNAIAVATKNTNLEADNTLALAAKDSTVLARDSVVLGGEKITINPAGQASLAVWSKINVLGASGALVFNGKTIPLQVDTASAHTMVVNADNGLIINTNNSNNQKIQLTVSGAIKLWEVNNAPAQASPYIFVKTKGSVTCVCGKVNNQNSALSKYTRGNKQIADLCQKVCDDQNTTLTAQCGAAATNYPLTQTQWSTDDFCQWGLGHAGAKPTFPTLGGQVSWTCESFPSGGPTCTATRKGCGDGIRAAGEQCDLGTNNGKPDSNCSVSCENVKAPKCWANAKTYLGSDVAWAQPNGFCTDDSVLEEATPAFWNGSTSGQKTWTCKNKNNKNLTCSANRLPPAVAGACGTTLNTCSAGTLSGQTSITHGKRWSCDGLYGGSNKTCSTCDSGYKYNTTTNICEVDCPNPIYRHTNGVTIKAAACAESGKEYMFEGQKYYVARDKDDIKQKIATNSYPANRIVTTRVTELNNLFENNNTFNQDIWNWDTSNVTSMIYTFRQAYAFNQDINYWDVSKVRDMSWMFLVASAFNKPLNRWNTSNVENMADMFAVTYNFNQDISNWDVSKVNTMRHMFAYTTNYNKPLTNWNTSNVRNMDRMFWESKTFNQPVAHLNISNVTTMVGMFSNNPVFNQPLNGWGSKLHNNVNLTNTFRGATAFNQPLDQWKIWIKSDAHLTTMFSGATAFKANQPYCNWANWSAKKWNFVNMGLNACINGQCKAYPWNHASQPATATVNGCVGGDYQDIADDANNWKWKCIGKYGATSTECSVSKQPTCPSGFTASNGKCVKWKCENTPASSSSAKCEGTYQTEKCYFADYGDTKVNPDEFSLAKTSNCLLAKNQHDCNDILRLRPRDVSIHDWWTGYDLEDTDHSFYQVTKWIWEGLEAAMQHIRWPWLRESHSSSLYLDRSIVIEENLCSWTTDTTPKSCLSLTQAQCGQKIWCHRSIWTTTPASTKSICVDDQWNTIPESFCSNAWPKPSCTSLVNGQCKIHAWTSASQPATVTANGCIAGEYEDIPDDTTNWKWKCNGKNWGTETICSAPKGATNPLDRKPWTVRFIVNCPDYISAIQIEWISKTPNEGPRYDDYYIDLPLVNSNGEMPTSEYPWLKRWYPVLNKTFDNAVRKITIVRDNPAPWKWWAYQINLPSHLIPQNLQEGGRYDIPTMSCLRPGEV